jgi:transcriptional regulator GlxA family with amidase domain
MFNAPGKCPECGHALVSKETAEKSEKKVAILIFDNVQIIDFAGPFEIFGAAGFRVYTVAPNRNPIRSIYGMKVMPDYDFSDYPKPDIIVLPGGGKHNPNLPAPYSHTLPIPDDPKITDWVRQNTATSKYTMSVCNGAFILARTGLLDNQSATTTPIHIESLAQAAPKTKVYKDRRYVANEKIVTSSGYSTGIDASLYIVEKLLGKDKAGAIARELQLAGAK